MSVKQAEIPWLAVMSYNILQTKLAFNGQVVKENPTFSRAYLSKNNS